jgi:hypothetical protein
MTMGKVWRRIGMGCLGAAIALSINAMVPGDRSSPFGAAPPTTIAAHSVQFPDGTVAFTTPPRLANFAATRNLAGVRNATYYFTVTLPAEAEAGLKTLEIALIEGRANRLDFDLDDTAVFVGTRDERGSALPLEGATYDEDSQTVTLTLAEAAAPGQILTFALHPRRNPRWEGVYLFELTAFPDGDLVRSQRVGTARLHIYRPDGRDPLF